MLKTKLTLAFLLATAVTWAQDAQTGQPVRAVRSASATTAAWTSGTADETTLAVAVGNFSTVAVSFNKSGTISGGVIEFEVSDDGTNYYPVLASRSGAQTLEATYTLTGTSMLWQVGVAGFTNFRVRLSTVITNTGTANIRIQGIAAPVTFAPVATVNSLPNVTIGTMANLTETLVDDAGFTPASSRVFPVGLEFDDTSPDSVNEGDIGTPRMSANRNGYMTLRDAAGNERGANVDASGNLQVVNAAETTKVLGTVRTLGNVGGVMDTTTGSAVPANALYIGTNGSGNLKGLIACDNTAILEMTTATTTQIVAASGSTAVYVCGVSVQTGGASTVTMKHGTGSNCGTGTTTLSPAWEIVANSGIVEGGGLGMVYKTTASQALCFTSSAAVNVHIHVSYTQF